MVNKSQVQKSLMLCDVLTNYDNNLVVYESTGTLITDEIAPCDFYKYVESIYPASPTDESGVALYKHDIEVIESYNIINNNMPIYAYFDSYIIATEEKITNFLQCPCILLECIYQIQSIQEATGFSGITSESVTGHSVSSAVNKNGIPDYLDNILNRYRRPLVEVIHDKTARYLCDTACKDQN